MVNRFTFGSNWLRYVERDLDEQAINEARASLEALPLGLRGRSFLDLGSGSGLFSYCAQLLGASRVVSVDVDPDSVECARRLRARAGEPSSWEVLHGSVLDATFMSGLEPADLVYAWGSLHHTGAMWAAIRAARARVARGGALFLSIYNKHPSQSPLWVEKKRRFNEGSALRKTYMRARHIGGHLLTELMLGHDPVSVVRGYGERGMAYLRDVEDWLGGEPYEFATVEEITEQCELMGLERRLLNAPEGIACNEFLFVDRARPFHRALPAEWLATEGVTDPLLRGLIEFVARGAAAPAACADPHGARALAILAGEAAPAPLPAPTGDLLADVLAFALARHGDPEGDGLQDLVDRLLAGHDTDGGAWPGRDEEECFRLRTALSALGLPLPASSSRVDALLALPAPAAAAELLRHSFELARCLRQSSHRAREGRDRLRALATACLNALERGPDAEERAALLVALAEVQAVLPGWVRSARQLRTPLDLVPWLPGSGR